MSTSTVLENVSIAELQSLIKNAVRDELSVIPKSQKEAFLTRDELSEKLHLSTVTIDKYIRIGKLHGYRMGTRILFKESELNLIPIPTSKSPVK
jgi:excisionase family DNA binding protein